jgi:hypothetical protein
VNLGRARVVLRVRPLTDVFDLALRVLAENPLYRRLSLALLLPAWAITLGLRYGLHWGWRPVWAVAISLGVVLSGPFTVATGQLLFEEEARARAVLGRFARRLGTYLFALFLYRAPLGALMFLMLLYGGGGEMIVLAILLGPLVAFLFARRAFIHEVVLLEGGGGWARRTKQIVRHYAGTAFGLVFGSLAAQIACVVSVELIVQAVLDFVLQLGTPFGTLGDGGSPFALAGLFLAVPYVAVARFLTYVDLRTRKEGWDLQLKFAAIAAAEGEAAPEAAA